MTEDESKNRTKQDEPDSGHTDVIEVINLDFDPTKLAVASTGLAGIFLSQGAYGQKGGTFGASASDASGGGSDASW